MRERFGSVRKLPSGRYQVRYYGPDGQRHTGPETFDRKRDAERYLSSVEVQLMRDEWANPERARVRLQDYAERWIAERVGLRPRTVELYRWLLRKTITQHLGDAPLNRITPSVVRQWRARLLADGHSESIAAKAYRLLRAILATAVTEDRLLARNPCQIRGGDRENPAERPVLTVAQVFALAEAVPYTKLGMLVVLSAFCSLRWGEAVALRRCDIAADASSIRVTGQFVEVKGKGLVRATPKSRAGVRTVTVPTAIRLDLLRHLDEHTGADPDDLVFTNLSGGPLRRGNFNPLVGWRDLVASIGAPSLHFHDLRHTGNTLAAGSGTSLRDLMTRMGHDSPRAALIYQHATTTADELIADALSGLVDAHRSPRSVPTAGHEGTQGARTDERGEPKE